TSPAAGANWDVGSTQTITWTSAGTIANVKIELSRDGGTAWETLNDSVTNSGSYDWTVNAPASTTAMVRVSHTESTTFGTGETFTITQPGITLTSPNGGENWEIAGAKTITWTSTGTIPNVKIELSTDNGTSWTPISPSAPNTAGFDWIVPNTASTTSLVRISDAANSELNDSSDAPFTIAENLSIAITSPTPEDKWEVETQHTIAWSSTGNIATVNIEFSADNGSTWNNVATDLTNTGSYQWTVPGMASETCLLRVSDKDGDTAGTIGTPFTVFIPVSLQLNSPKGGETIKIGESFPITWNAIGLEDTVKLVLLKDGAPVGDIAVDLDADIGNHSWKIGEISAGTAAAGDGYQVRIGDTAGSYNDENEASFTLQEAAALTVTVGSPLDNSAVNTTEVLINGSVEGSTPTAVSIGQTNGEISGGNFYFHNFPLVNGENNLTIHVVAENGNTTDKSLTLLLDTTLPVLTVSTPVDGTPLPAASVTVQGTVTEANLESLRVNGVKSTVDSQTGAFSLETQLQQGANTITVDATDTAGNTATTSLDVIGDTMSPQIEVTTPENNFVSASPTVTLGGTVQDSDLTAVKINGAAAQLNGNQFTLDNVTLAQEGKNQITVEALDAVNNIRTATHTIYLDTNAPAITEVVPADAAIGVPVSFVITVTLGESINPDTVTAETVYVLDPDQQKLTGNLHVNGNTITFTPAPELPDETVLTLNVTAGVRDIAGHALSNPYIGTFATSDKSAPAAPVVEATPEKTSLQTLTISGTCEKDGVVNISGGATAASGSCGEDDKFHITISLLENQLNQLTLTVTDKAGNTGPALLVSIYQEASLFEVEDASLSGQTITIRFSRSIDVSTLSNASVKVIASGGEAAGSLGTINNDSTVTFTPSVSPASQDLRLDVSAAIKDKEGRSLFAPFTKMFYHGSRADSASVVGEVYDDRTGLPMQGATVTLLNSPTQPAPSAVTGPDGTYFLYLPGGKSIIGISREGYTSARRIINTAAGYLTQTFDARLMPGTNEPKTLTATAAALLYQLDSGPHKGKNILLNCPVGSVSSDTLIGLTPVNAQALQGRLPLGWSPLWAVDIRSMVQTESGHSVSGTPVFDKTVDLRVPNAWSGLTSEALALVRWDDPTAQWMAVGGYGLSPAILSVGIQKGGQYVFLVKDTGTSAPPPAIPGSPLANITGGAVPQDVDGNLAFSPAEIFAGDSSIVSLKLNSIEGSADTIPSGTALQADTLGQYRFINNSSDKGKLRTMDFTLYKYGTVTASLDFNLTTDQHITAETLQQGNIHTTIKRFVDNESVSRIDPAIDNLIEGVGASVFIPIGAVSQPIAVTVDKYDTAELGMTLPDNFDVLGAVKLVFTGETGPLSKPAVLYLTLEQSVIDTLTADSQLLVVNLEQTDLGYGWVLKGQCSVVSEDKQVKTGANPLSLPFTDITTDGTFLFLKAPADLGFISGAVTYKALPVEGVLVSSDTHDIAALSNGNYVQVGFMGNHSLKGRHLLSGDDVTAAAALATKNQVQNLPLAIEEAGPEIVAITPADSAEVEETGSVIFDFSDSILASTFNDTVVTIQEVLDSTASTVAGIFKLSGDGKQGQFVPAEGFTPGARVGISISTGLKNMAEVAMKNGFSSYFNITKPVEFTADESKIKLLIPESGTARAIGEVGAVSAGQSVVLIINGATSKSLSINSDGSFDLEFDASINDSVQLIITGSGGQTIDFGRTAFVSSDGNRRVVGTGADSLTVATGEGIRFEEGTFGGPVNVGLYPVDITEESPALTEMATMPEGFQRIGALHVDLSGAGVEKAFSISIPSPQNIPADAQNLFVALEVSVNGERKLMMTDPAHVVNGRIESGVLPTEQVDPWPGCQSQGIYSFVYAPGVAIGFVKGTVAESSHVVSTSSFASTFVHMVEHGGLNFILPVAAGSGPVSLKVSDPFTGETVYEGTVTAPDNGGYEVSAGLLFQDNQSPQLTEISGLKVSTITVPYSEVTAGGLTISPYTGTTPGYNPDSNVNGPACAPDDGDGSGGANEEVTVTITAEPGSSVNTTDTNDSGGTVRIYKVSSSGLEPLGEPFEAEPDGSFTKSGIPAKPGETIIVATEEGEIPTNQSFTFTFNEPLDNSVTREGYVKIVTKGNPADSPKVQVTLSKDNKTLTIRPKTSLKQGVKYMLIVNTEDWSGNHFDFTGDFRTMASNRIGSYQNTNSNFKVFDSVPYGGYLFVAAGEAGIQVLDVSNPAAAKNVLTLKNFSGELRGIALYGTDTDKKLVAVGGDEFSNGFLRMYDINTSTNILTDASTLTLVEVVKMHISKKRSDLGAFFTATTGPWPTGTPHDLQVLDNKAYISIFGSGLLVVDLARALELAGENNHDFGEARLGFYDEDFVIETRMFTQISQDGPRIKAAMLVENFGIRILDVTDPAAMTLQGEFEAEGESMGGIDVAAGFDYDADENGIVEAHEKKDLLFFTTSAHSSVTVLDITTPSAPTEFREIEIKDPIGTPSLGMLDIFVNKEEKIFYISGKLGFITMDATFAESDSINDTSGDRIISIVQTADNSQRGMVVDSALGIAYVGQQDKGLDIIRISNPKIMFIYVDTNNAAREVQKIAPSGLDPADNPPDPVTGESHPSRIYLKVNLPGGIGKTINAKLCALNAQKGPMVMWADDVNTVETIPMTRRSDNPESVDYNVFRSNVITITLTPDDNTAGQKLLSGSWIGASFDLEAGNRAKLSYLTDSNIAAAFTVKPSIPCMYIDSPNPNPVHNSSIGLGEITHNGTSIGGASLASVYLHSAEFFTWEVDINVPGRGFNFVFRRYYDSQSIYSGPLGWGWDHNFNKRLVELYNGDILYFDGQGRRERYKILEDDNEVTEYQSPPGYFTELKKKRDGSYMICDPQLSVEYYNPSGQLTQINDRYTNKMLFTYDHLGKLIAVEDTLNRIYTFRYFPYLAGNKKSQRLKSVTDFLKNTVEYDYYDNGDLKTVKLGDRVRTYAYSAVTGDIKQSHNLSSIKDAENVEYLKVKYITPDVASTLTLGNDAIGIVGGNFASTTDPRGVTKNYTHTGGMLMSLQQANHITSYGYNGDGLKTSITYPMGGIIRYVYDSGSNRPRSRGNLLSITKTPDARGGAILVTEYQYDANYNLVNYIKDPRGNVTTNQINYPGIIDFTTYADNTTTRYTYNDYGQLASSTDADNRVTLYEYYPSGPMKGYLQKVIADEAGDAVSATYLYNAYGLVTLSINGENGATGYKYDPLMYKEVTASLEGTKAITVNDVTHPPANLETTYTYYKNGLKRSITKSGITETTNYDNRRFITSAVTQGGALTQTATFQYDGSGNRMAIINPRGKTTTFTYDNRNLLSTKSIGNGATVISYTYNADGKRQTLTDGAGKIHTYNYDGHNRLKEIVNPVGDKISYTLDPNSNLTSIDISGSDSTSYYMEYDFNSVDKKTSRKVKNSAGDFNTTTFHYSKSGDLDAITMPKNNFYQYTLNGAGLPKQIDLPMEHVVKNEYDKRGFRVKTTETESGPTAKTHSVASVPNVLGKAAESSDIKNRKHKTTYNSKQFPSSMEEPGNIKSELEYDGLGRVVKEIRKLIFEGEAKNITTQYGYDKNNNLITTTDATNNETRYEYDDKDRLTSVTLPGGNANSTTYHGNDTVHTYTDFNGTTVTNTLDAAGRRGHRTITPAEGIEGTTFESTTYDGLGRIKSIENDDCIVEYVYNREGWLAKEIQKHKTNGAVTRIYEINIQYDANGNRLKLTYPSKIKPADTASTRKEIVYESDDLDRIDKITAGGDLLVDYDYEGIDKVLKKTLFKGIIVLDDIEYDSVNMLKKYSYRQGEKVLFHRGMEWYDTDLKKSETRDGVELTYGYDTLMRLRTKEGMKKGLKYSSYVYSLDDVENIKKVDPRITANDKETIFPNLVLTHNAKHQVTSADYEKTLDDHKVSIHVAPTYDANGNMTSFVHKYTYNYQNQLVGIVTGVGINIEYKYDGVGRRIEKKVTAPDGSETTRYVYDDWHVIEEWTAVPDDPDGTEEVQTDNNTTKTGADKLKARYVYGSEMDERILLEYDLPGDESEELAIFIPMQDDVGNVLGLADKDGKVVEECLYSTYGNPVFRYDTIPPEIEDVKLEVNQTGPATIVKVSEPVLASSLTGTVQITNNGEYVTGTTLLSDDKKSFSVTMDGTVNDGDTINVKIENIRDLEGNPLPDPFEISFAYSGQNIQPYDGVNPEVTSIIYKTANEIHVEFSEEVTAPSVDTSINISNEGETMSATITVENGEHWVVKPEKPLILGKEYKVWVKSLIVDKSGKALNELFHRFVVMNEDILVYEKPDSNLHANSKVGNNFLFHGRTYEPEVGLYYYRYRYYLPRIGRFLQPDPMEYKDSMNMYQSFNQNPVNFVDPWGLNSKREILLKRSRAMTQKRLAPELASLKAAQERLEADQSPKSYWSTHKANEDTINAQQIKIKKLMDDQAFLENKIINEWNDSQIDYQHSKRNVNLRYSCEGDHAKRYRVRDNNIATIHNLDHSAIQRWVNRRTRQGVIIAVALPAAIASFGAAVGAYYGVSLASTYTFGTIGGTTISMTSLELYAFAGTAVDICDYHWHADTDYVGTYASDTASHLGEFGPKMSKKLTEGTLKKSRVLGAGLGLLIYTYSTCDFFSNYMGDIKEK
ncbi:MAG: hypothetical protein GY765_13110, partial [bacterium]|nr:hypothetical protein [bacterium]